MKKYRIKEGIKPCNFVSALDSMVCDNCIFESIENIYKMEEKRAFPPKFMIERV